MSSRKLNVGVIGFGMSAQVFHCPLIASSAHLNLHMVVERRTDKSRELYPATQVARTTEELLEAPGIDLVVITTPNESHFVLAKAAIEAGKHVIVEKPFTVTSAQAKELAALADERKVVLGVYQNRRWDGDFLTVRQIIDAGLVGRVVEFESHFDRFRNFAKPNAWREKDVPGSGMLYDLGSHLIDQALVLFGRPTSVLALVENQRQIPGTTIDDDFTIILRFSSGVKCVLRSSMLARASPVLRYQLRGMNGTYLKHHLDPQEDQLKAGLVPAGSTAAAFGVEPEERWGTLNADVAGVHVVGKVETCQGRYLEFYDNVAKTILSGEREGLIVTAWQAADVIRVIELAKKSSEEGGKAIEF
ncbi:hypothetical protein BC936DRAFT_137881 [Jimgerdemannia flammicorona]|uniref:Oxidoreductase n=1 Tax=Jimgerdemannia flammicorona TaxID=994334 RepID=A0A433CWG8_9FUNG|nr:hypothetical protein BC936DRAFT_137881 [Jimgerdemannia flammicorona]